MMQTLFFSPHSSFLAVNPPLESLTVPVRHSPQVILIVFLTFLCSGSLSSPFLFFLLTTITTIFSFFFPIPTLFIIWCGATFSMRSFLFIIWRGATFSMRSFLLIILSLILSYFLLFLLLHGPQVLKVCWVTGHLILQVWSTYICANNTTITGTSTCTNLKYTKLPTKEPCSHQNLSSEGISSLTSTIRDASSCQDNCWYHKWSKCQSEFLFRRVSYTSTITGTITGTITSTITATSTYASLRYTNSRPRETCSHQNLSSSFFSSFTSSFASSSTFCFPLSCKHGCCICKGDWCILCCVHLTKTWDNI